MTGTAPNPHLAMVARTQSAAQDGARATNPALASFTHAQWEKTRPTLPAEVMEAIIGRPFNPDAPDAKTRLLLMMAGLTTTQGATAAGQLRLTVRHAAAGAMRPEIAQTVGPMVIFGGKPAVQKATDLAIEALEPTDEATGTPARGAACETTAMGDAGG